tara:strand:+ start:4890 stop:5051 length:162 start_codon:yes stop_codon:yes gene_type:complete
MTSRSHIQLDDPDILERMAWDLELPVEPDAARGLMFLRVGTTTFAAPMREVTG